MGVEEDFGILFPAACFLTGDDLRKIIADTQSRQYFLGDGLIGGCGYAHGNTFLFEFLQQDRNVFLDAYVGQITFSQDGVETLGYLFLRGSYGVFGFQIGAQFLQSHGFRLRPQIRLGRFHQ